MKQTSLFDLLAEDEGSLNGVTSAIGELCDDLRNGATDEWTNTNLLDFLEAMQAWVQAMGPRIGEKPSWKFLEVMLKAASIYE